MEIKIDIVYDSKYKFYRLKVYDDKGKNMTPSPTSRVYENEYDAEMAAALMKIMFEKIDSREDFDIGLFEFNIRAILRLIDSPGKW